MVYNTNYKYIGDKMNQSEILTPAVTNHLKAITLGNFLSEITHPAFSDDDFEVDGYIFDFIESVTDSSSLFEAYLAETGENIPVCEVYENLSPSELQSEIMDHYACLKTNYLILSKMRPEDTE
jgi:hypothetical protein